MYELSLYMIHAQALLLRAYEGSTGWTGLISITSAVGEDELAAPRCDPINPGETVPGV